MLSGRDTISGCGPKGTFTDEEFKSFRDAILSYLSLCQANLEAEKNPDDLIAVIKAITEKNSHVKKLKDARAFWRRLQIHLAPFIDLDKEALVEMRRQFWTTISNLSQWYDGWENFLVYKDFATKEADGSLVFTEKQKQHIINIDETKLSDDGSDGGVGGRPPSTIHVKGQFRTGTATNKSSVSSTLICGSNAAGEAIPVVVVFPSERENEENYKIRAG